MFSDAPLSFGQEAIWLHQRKDPGRPVHNSSVAFRLSGKLSVETLRRSVQALVERHPALRTSFATHGDAVTQRVTDDAVISMRVLDLGNLPPGAAQDRVAQQVLAAESRHPFDLSAAPLMRCAVLRLDDVSWIVILTVHRIVCDRPSRQILLRDLEAEYAHLLVSAATRPAGQARSHLSHAIRQRDVAGSATLESRVAARVRALAGAPAVSVFRGDHPRSPHSRHTGSQVRTVRAGSELRATAKRLGVPAKTLAIATFALLVHRQTGQPDIVFGTTADLRGTEFDDVVGHFGNVLTIRSQYSAATPLPVYLNAIATDYQRASDDRSVPFDYLLPRLSIERVAGRRGLVQLEFDWRESAKTGSEIALDGLDAECMLDVDGRGDSDFSFLMELTSGDVLRCTAEYRPELYSPEAASRLLDHYQVLLETVLANPERPLSGYPLATALETAQLRDWNSTAAEFPSGSCMHDLIENQARRTPDASAVVYGGHHLTYAELDRRASHLAHLLKEKGVRADGVVGICMDRSAELVIGLLAILKAGAGYLPLDPETPRARLERLVTDAHAGVCLTSRHRQRNCPETVPTMCLDAPWPAARRGVRSPRARVSPDNLVSVYYTSGSTGRPKAVANTHRGWVNRMSWMQRRHQLRAGETVLHKTTLTFDDSALELFWPLSVGGCVALIAPDLHRDPEAILRAAVIHRTVHLQMVPSMLAMLLDSIRPEHRVGMSSLRSTVSSGEALSADLVRRFRRLMPGRLHNTWGATEVSIDSTDHRCVSGDEAASGAVTVGMPFDNNQVYVLDPLLRELPADVAGDLFIGGVGLARGYLGDPAKTAGAFVANPFRPGERMYRTGDQGSRRGDGSIMFIGRQDYQVKIRGMRVELGEVEAVLRGHPDVGEAVVTVGKAEDGQLWLAGYVTPRDGLMPTEESLRQHLGDWLPTHMRPAVLHVLQRLPLNPNGKIDRSQLPAPEPEKNPDDAGQPVMTGEFEPVIAAIWQAVLLSGPVGADSNFFDMGGQSLMASRVVTRIRRHFGVDLPLRELFRAPVLREFSAEVERRVAGQGSAESEDGTTRLLQQEGR